MPNHEPDLSANAMCEPRRVQSRSRLRYAFSRCALSRYALSWLPAASLFAGLTLFAGLQAAHAQDNEGEIPFKFQNVHLETNESACDMGIQILFDTEGITSGKVKDPDGHVIYDVRTRRGFAENGGLTETFLEGVEPPIIELEDALGCEPDPDAISLDELQDRHPPGVYEFEGQGDGEVYDGTAELTYRVPKGPTISTPADGDDMLDPDAALEIVWTEVGGPILPVLGPIEIVGYHVVVKDATDQVNGPLEMGPLPPHQFDVDVPRNSDPLELVHRVEVPAAFLEPDRIYEFEVLTTELYGNQTITEGGVFCTDGLDPIDPCELPD